MGMRTAFVLALVVNFLFGDEICENTDGDLFRILNPNGSYMQHLKLDDHKYTMAVVIGSIYKEEFKSEDKTEINQTLLLDLVGIGSKEDFHSEDKIEINEKLLLDLVRNYGFKDADLIRKIGFQKRIKGTPEDPEASCYFYECDASVANVDCNLKPNTPSCKFLPAHLQ